MQAAASYKVSHVLASERVYQCWIKLIRLCTGFGWFQAAEYLKSVFLEILYVTIRSVFQNLVII